MKFNYSGTTRSRESVSGSLEAQDEVEARMRLRALQIRPTELHAQGEVLDLFAFLGSHRKTKPFFNLLTKPVSGKDLAVFTRQFSSLIDSGVPIVQCLQILWEQQKKGYFKNVLKNIQTDIESGSGLADALGRHRDIFSEFFIRVIEAGEISGTLDKAFRRVGAQLEKLNRLRAKVIGALVYPALTMLIAVIVLIIMLVKVIPEIASLYADANAQLPGLTLFVLGLSEWFRNFWVYLLGLAVGIGILSIFLARVEGFRQFWDPLWLKVPLFGTLTKKSAIASFTRTLATLLSSGVPLLNSFEICLKLITNRGINNSVQDAGQAVSEGMGIAQGLARRNLFPPMVIHMVSIGEITGRLDDLLGKVADIYDEEVDDVVNILTGLLQPILIIGVGALIAGLLLAMYLPIFSLAEKVAG